MKLGMAVILLPSRPTNCFAFFVHVSGNPSVSKQTIRPEQRCYVPIVII